MRFSSGFVVFLRIVRNQKNPSEEQLIQVFQKLTAFILVFHQKKKLKAFIY